MNTIKINEQIAFLRKQKGMTQEDADIARRARLKEEQAAAALENLPVEIREEDDEYLYRLEGAFLHVPQVLEMLCI